MPHDLLQTLREQVRRIERPTGTAHGVVPFRIAAIDSALPGGGLARGALHEILGAGGDEEDGALAAAFAAGIVAELAPAEDDIVLWCLARPDLYGPGLAVDGLDPARLIMVRAARDAEILWAMEEGLHTPGVAAVIGEIGTLSDVASRRLQLAAEHSGTTAFVLRRWRNGEEAARERNLSNAAATRWRVAALPSHPIPIPDFAGRLSPLSRNLRARLSEEKLPAAESDFRAPPAKTKTDRRLLPYSPLQSKQFPLPVFRRGDGNRMEPGIGHPRWRVELLRCRSGEPGCWEVEVREGKMTDATNSISLVRTLADRPKTPVGRNAAALAEIRRTG
jgi:protein ImuA